MTHAVGVATPDLYRGNAFRRSGLPTDASPRELAEAGDGYAPSAPRPAARPAGHSVPP